MSGVVVWAGPVSTVNLASVALPPDWSILTISREIVAPSKTVAQGITPNDFRAYVATLGADPLGALMAKAGSPERAILASFSAGHGLLDPVLLANAGDARLLGVFAADSYYGLPLKQGYVAQAQHSIQTGTPFWLSTSSAKGGVTIHSGEESIVPFVDALGLVQVAPPPNLLPPVATEGMGGVLWLDYADTISHQEHATVLAPEVLRGWFQAGIASGQAVPEERPAATVSNTSGTSGWVGAASFLGGAVVGVAGVVALRSR